MIEREFWCGLARVMTRWEHAYICQCTPKHAFGPGPWWFPKHGKNENTKLHLMCRSAHVASGMSEESSSLGTVNLAP